MRHQNLKADSHQDGTTQQLRLQTTGDAIAETDTQHITHHTEYERDQPYYK